MMYLLPLVVPQVEHPVRVCQVGYLPKEAKIVAVVGDPTGPAVVRRLKDGAEILRAECGAAKLDGDSGETIRQLDLSKLTKPGQYIVDVPGVGKSDPFFVKSDVYEEPLWLAMRSFTGQRCGIAVNLGPKYPQFHYPACHLTPAKFDASTGKTGQKLVSGGWHDAGDYGRYIVNAGVSTSALLWAFEDNRASVAKMKLDLPDPNPKVPDFLTEIRWNLNWMLGMQDTDGGVWHKESTAHHAAFVMPDKDTNELLIIGQEAAPFKVTTATADFAATMAAAARSFNAYDRPYAQQCLSAAERAWKWAIANPDSLFKHNPKGIGTGPYSDEDPRDELLWAAAELFRATGKEEYNRYFLDHYRTFSPVVKETRVPGWGEVSAYAMFAYAKSGQKSADPVATNEIKAATRKAADEMLKIIEGNGYRVPMIPGFYYWGSNGGLANLALMLENASLLTGRPQYKGAARECLHYLFGQNTFATSYVTQLGARWPMNPHHRPSAADGVEQPWPGLLVGGPNADGKPLPARQWEDKTGNYRVNEVAINWNAPLVYVLACEGRR